MSAIDSESRFGLIFRDSRLEAEFQSYYDRRYSRYSRIAVVMGLFLYMLFGLLDRYLFPDVYQKLWLIRFGIALPMLLIGFALLMVWRGAFRIQLALSLSLLVAGVAVLAMIVHIPVHYHNPYYAGLMLVIFYTHAFVRLQFVWASLVSLLLLAGYEFVGLVLRPETPPEELVSGNFFFVTAIIMGMAASFTMERDARKQFLLQRRLSEERNRLREANRKLYEINARLDAEAHVDELTGIANRRKFLEHLNREWRRQLRAGDEAAPLSLLLIDIDHFKDYNDHYGHLAGDECLRNIAEIIASFEKRPADLAARIGGEEFVLLLPEANIASAQEIAEELRLAVEEGGIEHAASPVAPHVTISIGVACLVPQGRFNPSDLLHDADRALYEAKRAGRNLVATIAVATSSGFRPLQ